MSHKTKLYHTYIFTLNAKDCECLWVRLLFFQAKTVQRISIKVGIKAACGSENEKFV